MKIEHIAYWTKDLEAQKEFWLKYFDCTVKDKYCNPKKNYTSYFISFKDGARIELMHNPSIASFQKEVGIGLAHISIVVGSRTEVDLLTERLRNDGFSIVGEPRTTGDGYYESVFIDSENNKIELTSE